MNRVNISAPTFTYDDEDPPGSLAAPQGALLGGAIVAFVVLALGLAPRETRMLERLGDRSAPFALPDHRQPHAPVA